ncbi:MAG: IS200/IS605 family transposase [Planctomycetes bacterium]|nr:IS200/IS605 family transposase [Planctomycetota bacterium]MBL7043866.1 IS200/IS605 family transposase [Pirellulaceae bacterium]
MFIQPYQLEELRFAWCYRVYYRWQTHRARPQPALRGLDQKTLDSMLQPYDIHILEACSSETDVKVLISLLPSETVAACAGKMKGRVSKWLGERRDLRQPSNQKRLSRGYFACTTGKSTAEAVNRYLDQQSEHHGYAARVRPPMFVRQYPITVEDEQRLSANRAMSVLQYHVVLSTWKRKGVFARAAAESMANAWRRIQGRYQMAIEKVSFVPDHVHVAVRAHPSQSPAEIAVALMNSSQDLMWSSFSDSVIRAGVERLWQASAYIGTYGNLESAKISAYVRRWKQGEGL